MSDREFLILIRQALLMALDAIERKLEMMPRTAEIRKDYKKSLVANTEHIC